jgi:hypothetical protein
MSDVAAARSILDAENLAFVIVRDQVVLARGAERGVSELFATIETLGANAKDASLADKVIGKAVALIAISAGIRAVSTPLASRSAERVLRAHGLAVTADAFVPEIMNRKRDALCPLEQLTHSIDDASMAVMKLREFFAAQKAG